MRHVDLKILGNYPEEYPVLERGSVHAVGYDLRSAEEEFITLAPGEYHLFRCGIAIGMPPGLECQIRPRSGLANKKKLIIPNSPGTIDPDYRGEIMVGLLNVGTEEQYVVRGERIAQAVFAHYENVIFEPVDELEETDRGESGFGSTGEV